MLVGFPLLIIPFAFFNMAVFLLNMSFTETVFSIPLQRDREMPVDLGDLIVAIGMLLLWIELVKAVRPGGKSMIEHEDGRAPPVQRMAPRRDHHSGLDRGTFPLREAALQAR